MLSVKRQTVPLDNMVYKLLVSNLPIKRNSSVKLWLWRVVSIHLNSLWVWIETDGFGYHCIWH
jgi:hypothetical protein